MGRLLLVLAAVGVLIWLGERYFVTHPDAQKFMGWDNTTESTPTPAPAAGASPSATPEHTVATCRAALWTQTQKLLQPLDQNKDFSPAQTINVLRETERYLVQYRNDPAWKPLTQACGVLAQVAQERQGYLERYQRAAAATSTATPTPGALHTGNLQPTVGTELQGMDSNNFFKQRVVTEWGERCSYYTPIIDGLLTGSSGAN